MRDIPVFTTQYGVASLILSQIPYRKEAYIRVQAETDPERLIGECARFCRIAGAEKVYATGSRSLSNNKLHCSVVTMSGGYNQSDATDAVLVPANEETLENWREICNDRMKNVDNASYLTVSQAKILLGKSYFVYKNSNLIGICAGKEGKIDVVASVVSGSGEDIVLALCQQMNVSNVMCEVASTNTAAVKLYERLGFRFNDDVTDWYCVE